MVWGDWAEATQGRANPGECWVEGDLKSEQNKQTAAQIPQYGDRAHPVEVLCSEAQGQQIKHHVFAPPEITLPSIQVQRGRAKGNSPETNDGAEFENGGTPDFGDRDRGKSPSAEFKLVPSLAASVGTQLNVGKGKLSSIQDN
ncbi:hypothetical protein Salat_1882900 [Sesamum alatum]|uniref:Uncharacterized protein n=1 Tax=Sesamum alatum TaxID=300844 RepID=A0AAE2CI40_9LAMI|nr:hypothetical protein Salat_1882900 [Sesamum alatum]